MDPKLIEDIERSLDDIQNGRFIEFGSISEFKEKLKEYPEINT